MMQNGQDFVYNLEILLKFFFVLKIQPGFYFKLEIRLDLHIKHRGGGQGFLIIVETTTFSCFGLQIYKKMIEILQL